MNFSSEMDVETGGPPHDEQWTEEQAGWRSGFWGDPDQRNHEAWLAGVLLFIFVAGWLPFSFLILVMVSMVCISTLVRAYGQQRCNMMHELNATQGEIARMEDALQLLRARLLPGQQLDLTNLQLSLVQRDFTGSDYDSLLALDESTVLAPGQSVPDKCIKALPTFIHQRTKSVCSKEGEEHLCSVCLDAFAEGVQVMQLGCKHHFHPDCIQPWLKLQGRAAACPLCKQLVFPSSEGQVALICAHR